MSDQRTFTNVDDAALIENIARARHKIVFAAPGVQKAVAAALAKRLAEKPPLDISIILDIDPEVCRLGYGHIDGLLQLKTACKKHGSLLLHQPGLRIGLLIADSTTLVYSPPPLLIYGGSTQPDKPNAIQFDTGAVPQIDAACTGEGDERKREIGLDPARTPDIQVVSEDLKANPPQQFDVSQKVRVFNSIIQYVEMKFKDSKLSLRQVNVPSELLGLADDAQMAARWHNTFRPFQQSQSFNMKYAWKDDNGCERTEYVTEETLTKERYAIKKDYLKDIAGHGTVIRRAQVPNFEKRVKQLEVRINEFKAFVNNEIDKVIKDSAGNLLADLWPKVRGRSLPFPNWVGADENQQRQILLTRLQDLMRGAVDEFAPSISCTYKDVSYSSLLDPKFRTAVMETFGDEAARFFNEYDASPAEPVRQEAP